MEKITSDMKLIKVLASEARREDVPEDQVQEAADIMVHCPQCIWVVTKCLAACGWALRNAKS